MSPEPRIPSPEKVINREIGFYWIKETGTEHGQEEVAYFTRLYDGTPIWELCGTEITCHDDDITVLSGRLEFKAEAQASAVAAPQEHGEVRGSRDLERFL